MIVWLLLFVLVPVYAMASVAMGGVDPILGSAVPRWNPITWNPGNLGDVVRDVVGGWLGAVVARTIVFVALACLLCVTIGYPVAYFVARRAGRRRGVYLALILLPFWINYLMRMLAWVPCGRPAPSVTRSHPAGQHADGAPPVRRRPR